MLRSVETGVVQTDQVDVEVLDQTQGGRSLTYDCDDRADKDSGGVTEAHEQGARTASYSKHCTLRT
jgi:hypothetical protein